MTNTPSTTVTPARHRTGWHALILLPMVALLAASCACSAAPLVDANGAGNVYAGSVRKYGSASDQRIEVLQPGKRNGPVLLSIVGGGYHGLNTDVTPEIAKAKSDSWRVLQLTYTPGTVNSVEAQVDTGLAWVAANTDWAAWGDLGNLRVAGESAGGQAAVRGVLKNTAYKTTKVYSLAGTTELDEWYRHWAGNPIGIDDTIKMVTSCGTPTWRSCGTVRDASPRTHFRSGPRVTFIHGRQDGMVPISVSRLSHERFPGPSTLREVDGNHFDATFVRNLAPQIT